MRHWKWKQKLNRENKERKWKESKQRKGILKNSVSRVFSRNDLFPQISIASLFHKGFLTTERNLFGGFSSISVNWISSSLLSWAPTILSTHLALPEALCYLSPPHLQAHYARFFRRTVRCVDCSTNLRLLSWHQVVLFYCCFATSYFSAPILRPNDSKTFFFVSNRSR